MALVITVVDAFTDRPFAGNPAAVTVVEQFPEPSFMQDVAREMALSETSFVVPRPDGQYDLRWFTPTTEVDLCGHATLAAAHVLGGAAVFHTRGGPLSCRPADDGTIRMDFPADPPKSVPVPDGFALTGMVGYLAGRSDVLIELAQASAVRGLVPDLAALAALGTRGVVVTAPGDRPGVDCVSRMFAPNVGIAEDPATGSAHCMLAEHWGERTGKTSLVGEQASARGATVFMVRHGHRVELGGHAVTVSTCTMHV